VPGLPSFKHRYPNGPALPTFERIPPLSGANALHSVQEPRILRTDELPRRGEAAPIDSEGTYPGSGSRFMLSGTAAALALADNPPPDGDLGGLAHERASSWRRGQPTVAQNSSTPSAISIAMAGIVRLMSTSANVARRTRPASMRPLTPSREGPRCPV